MHTLKIADHVEVRKDRREIVYRWACPSQDKPGSRGQAELTIKHSGNSKKFSSMLRLVQAEDRGEYDVTTWAYGDPSCWVLIEPVDRYSFARLEDFAERSLHALQAEFRDGHALILQVFGTDGHAEGAA